MILASLFQLIQIPREYQGAPHHSPPPTLTQLFATLRLLPGSAILQTDNFSIKVVVLKFTKKAAVMAAV
jgi:hypothetical protein